MAAGLPDTIDKVTEVVPEVFYDLIARIAPGMLFLLGAIHFLDPDVSLPVWKIVTEHVMWALFIGGYVVGLLLAQGSVILFDFLISLPVNALLKWGAARPGRLARFGDWMGGQIGDQHLVPRIDRIAARSAESGKVLRKMLAEKVLIENLLTGSLVMILLEWYFARDLSTDLLVFAAVCLPCWAIRVLLLAARVVRMAALGFAAPAAPAVPLAGGSST